jgi:hypothetical protein
MATKSPKPTRPSPARAGAKPRRPAAAPKPAKAGAKRVPAPVAVAGSKQSTLITLLRTGASMAELLAATGWQAHSVRGVISGVLRKKLGLKVVCTGEAGSRLYRIVGPA